MGRWIVIFGLLLVGLGFILHFKVDVPWLTGWIGTLPGDMTIKKGNLTIYVPLTTSLLISLVVSIVLSLFFKSGSEK